MDTGCLNWNSLTATVTTRPSARRAASTLPAMSTCAMIQPPKMSPFWLASAGIGTTRNAGCFPSGSCSFIAGILPALLQRLDVVQRSAAERGEAGAEDEAGVDEIRVGDHAIGERGLRFSQIRLDQALDQRLVVGVGLAFYRLAILVAVDALAGLLAEVAERHFVGEHLRDVRVAAGFAGVLRQALSGGEADVQTDGVGELGRPH